MAACVSVLISTGLDAAKAVLAETLASPTAKIDTQTGTLIAPHRLGVNHDHFFSYRIDFDIDGTANDFSRMRLVATPQAKTRHARVSGRFALNGSVMKKPHKRR